MTEAEAGLIGGVVGALLSGLGQFLHGLYTRRQERLSLSAALAGEVGAVLRLIERRGYVEHYRRCAGMLDGVKESVGAAAIPVIAAEQDYAEVFRASVERVGLLGPLAGDVSAFYALSKGLLDTNAELRRQRAELLEGKVASVPPAGIAHLCRTQVEDLEELLRLGKALLKRLDA